ncbi:MAG: hypothetical protein IKB49_03490 [Alphaproteobacteria bacterium]|nr:hypothetical protein [Alphaproteobacteria bacterium]
MLQAYFAPIHLSNENLTNKRSKTMAKKANGIRTSKSVASKASGLLRDKRTSAKTKSVAAAGLCNRGR